MTATIGRNVIAGVSVLLLTSTSAFAVDAEAFADRLKAVIDEQDMTFTYQGAEEVGGDVALTGASLEFADGHTLELGDLTFEGVTGTATEGFSVERLPIENLESQSDETTSRISGLVLEGIQIAGTSGADAQAMLGDLYFGRAAVDSLEATREGVTTFSLSDAEIVNELSDDGTFSAAFDVASFEAPVIENPEGEDVMAALGYDALRGSASGEIIWERESGMLSLAPLRLDIEDAGEMVFSYEIDGYTPDFIEAFSQMQAQMAQQGENGEGGSMAVIGLLSQLYLNEAELSFTDDSLTGRLLDYYAEQNGVPREEFVQSLVATLPPMLAGLQNPEFSEEITSAVSEYLQNPQSISVAVDPSEPIPAMQILGAAMGAPQTLPDVLNVEITANQAGGDATAPAAQEGEAPASEMNGDAPAAEDAPATDR